MRWNTAIQHIGQQDADVISQMRYGARLEIPSSCLCLYPKETVRLAFARQTSPARELALPRLALDTRGIEQMLWEEGLPLTGWVPGHEHFMSPYNKFDICFAILDTARQIVAERGRKEVSIAALRARVGLKGRTFTLHMLNLLEDAQGLIAVDAETVRLATWKDAMQASSRLIKSLKNRTHDDIVQPECQLGLVESPTLCDWKIMARSKKPLLLFPISESHPSVAGNKAIINAALQRHTLPDGWAATYGNNESEDARIEQKVQAQIALERK